MAATDSNPMALPPEKLNGVDEWVLDWLAEHDWGTVNLMRAFYLDSEGDISRQWLASRVGRLTEHGHLEKVKDTRTYRLASDPRDN